MGFEHLPGRLSLQALGCEVKQTQRFIAQSAQGLLAAIGGQAGMQTGGGDATSLQLQHLILHQSHQWGNNHDESPTHQRRQLIAERLSTAGGQHREGIPPRQNRFHHGTLTSPESRPAEMLLE